MYEASDEEKLRKILNERLKSIHELYSGDLISRNTLSSQLLEFIATNEAKTLWDIAIKKDITARRMLTMLEDPEQWKIDSSSPEDKRRQILKERLSDIFLAEENSPQEVLEKLLDTASLPHFESVVFSRNGKSRGKKSGAKLSVLD